MISQSSLECIRQMYIVTQGRSQVLRFRGTWAPDYWLREKAGLGPSYFLRPKKILEAWSPYIQRHNYNPIAIRSILGVLCFVIF